MQRTYRSFSVRLYLQNEGIHLGGNGSNNDHNDSSSTPTRTTRGISSLSSSSKRRQRKQIALKKAEIDFNNKRIQQRKWSICRCFDYNRILQDRIQGHVNTLKEAKIKYESMLRKQSNAKKFRHQNVMNEDCPGNDIGVQRRQQSSYDAPLLRRFEDRQMHLNEIVRVIDDQIAFVYKLRAKSATLTKYGLTKLKETQEKWKSVQYAIDFVDSKEETAEINAPNYTKVKTWIEKERGKLIQALVECDINQEKLLDQECLRLEHELEILASSSTMYHALTECIWNIETWEAERFGIQTTLMNESKNISDASEAEMYFQLIDDNQMKLNSERKKRLPKLYDEAGDLYHGLLETLEKDVCFQSEDNSGNMKANLKPSMTLPSTENYCWSLMEWMDYFTKTLQCFLDKDHINLKQDEQRMRDHYKETLEYAHNRRELLLSKQSMKKQKEQTSEDLFDDSISTASDPTTLTKLKWGLFGTSSTISNTVQSRATDFVRDFTNINRLHSKLNDNTIIPAITKVMKKNEDEELQQMKTVVKKTMNGQFGNNVIGVTSLKFTVGKEETREFSEQNDLNEATGKSFYQNRIDLGNHIETVLWVQIESSSTNYVTSISWAQRENMKHLQTSEIISHDKLECVLSIGRDSNSPKVISSLQITYANSNQHEILGKDYEIVPRRLSEFDLADAYLWVSTVDRTMKRTSTDFKRMKRELAEYEEMLCHNPNDYLLQGLVNEMERRITLTQRKEKEQRGLTRDHVGYITEFLALSEREVNLFKKIFLKISQDLDGAITIHEFVDFIDEQQRLTEILAGCIGITLGNLGDGNSLSFGEFVKSIGIIGMFSHTELMKCLFCAIDKEGFGFIPKKEFYILLSILHPENEIGTASRSIRDVPIPESLSFDFFKNLETRFPILFFPVSRMQQSIRNKCLGSKWWNKKMRKFLQAKELVMKEKESRATS